MKMFHVPQKSPQNLEELDKKNDTVEYKELVVINEMCSKDFYEALLTNPKDWSNSFKVAIAIPPFQNMNNC